MTDDKDQPTNQKTVKIGDANWLIVDDGILPVIPSLFVEARQFDGMIYLSLAHTVVDESNPPEARVCARLRMGLGFAQLLRGQLDSLINNAMKPADTSKAN